MRINSMTLNVLLLVGLLISRQIHAENSESGWANFDAPAKTSNIKLGKSNSTDADIIQNCYFYPTRPLTIFEIDDPGVMGATKVGLRAAIASGCEVYKQMPGDLVLDSLPGSQFQMTDPVYFEGIYQNLILMAGADSFGGGRYFEILKFSTKKITSIYHDTAHDKNHSIKFIQSANGVIGLEYWKELDSDCSLVSGNDKETCWTHILEMNKITNKLTKPHCDENYKKVKAPADAVSLIFVHTRINDIQAPKLNYDTSVMPVCEASP